MKENSPEMSSHGENTSSASFILAREVSEELQRKLHRLTASHHNSEKLLRYLTLCLIDNETVESASQEQPLGGNGSSSLASKTETKLLTDERKCFVSSSSRGLDSVSFIQKTEAIERPSPLNANSDVSLPIPSLTSVGSSSLEDVLCMAREIREKKTGRKATGQDSLTERDKSVKTYAGKTTSKGNNFGATSKCGLVVESGKLSRKGLTNVTLSKKVEHISHPLAERDVDFFGDTCDNVDVSIREHLFALLDTISRHKRSLHHIPVHGMNKDLYLSQEQYLSKLKSRRMFPRSIAYSALKFEKGQLVTIKVRDSYLEGTENASDDNDDITNTLNYLDVLASVLSECKDRYNRQVKNKLLRTPVHKMCKEDIKDIFKSWYETQKHLNAYTTFTDKNMTEENDAHCADVHDMESEKLQDMRMHLIDSLPITQFSHLISITDESLLARDWLKESTRKIESYHDEYDVRVRYLIETSIGRNELKSAIQRLKSCCASESGMSRNNQCPDLNSMSWIAALKCYRGVHTCLTSFSQNGASCMFIPSRPS